MGGGGEVDEANDEEAGEEEETEEFYLRSGEAVGGTRGRKRLAQEERRAAASLARTRASKPRMPSGAKVDSSAHACVSRSSLPCAWPCAVRLPMWVPWAPGEQTPIAWPGFMKLVSPQKRSVG